MKSALVEKIQSSSSGLSFLIENTDSEQILAFFDQLQMGLAVNDPDVYKLDSDSIKIKEIRDLQSFINLKPYNSSCKIALVLGADKLNLASANALLKTLEEPPQKTFIFLSASSKDEVLPTIISRCQLIRLPEKLVFLSNDEMEKISQELLNIKEMNIKDKFDLAKELSERDDLLDRLTGWLKYYRSEMIRDQKPPAIIQKILVVIKILSKYNVNKRLVVENLLLLV